ncbi:MAG: ABC-type dipeptide/oligopeptide/nickel transport system, permease component [halophilic archaeon J07HB67]|jgi:ABC-type dipeptide/oligopeptide/nickel transport systems, permease components|nr:MAG: ABC-type dipeptide/oligopeptide/nickel transport system, permease component [halophilic archaeon J07HB67]
MATQDPNKQFDQVDWEEISQSTGTGYSVNFLGTVVSMAALFALLAYDFLLVGQFTPTFEFVGWGYDVSQLDFLFAASLIVFAFYGVLPLYQNKRMTRYYWRQFKKNRPAVISLVWLVAIFLVGTLGPVFIPAPEVALLQKYQPPAFTSIANNYPINCVGPVVDGACQGTLQHPLGTTQQGKDILTMIVYGMQISMKIAFITTLIVITIGTAVGTTAAYASGLVDEVLMRWVDIQQSFPTFILYLLILYIWGGGLFLFIVLFGLFAWEGTARYTRSNALSKVEEEYIKAVQLSGAGTYRIVRRHVVPNTASSIITNVTLLIPGFILAEAQLAFLGLGDSTVPSWGQLISIGRDDLAFAPWITLAPGLFLFFTILAFNFLGDALLDALNPEANAENEQ